MITWSLDQAWVVGYEEGMGKMRWILFLAQNVIYDFVIFGKVWFYVFIS